MLTTLRLRSLALLVVSLVILGGGVSLADGPDGSTDDPVCVPTEVADEGETDGTDEGETCLDDQGEDGEGPVEEEEGSETSGATDADDTAVAADEVTDVDREGECNSAAGVEETDPEAEPSAEPEAAATGLDHAIEVVLANCIRNEQAPGLVNALERLVINRDRHEAHDEAKAERAAARDAAKAARHAAHDAAKAAREAAHDAAKAARDAAHAAKQAEHGPR